MFSRDVIENTKLVDVVFFAGAMQEDIKESLSNLVKFHTNVLKPDILFSFPENKDMIYSSIVDFIFPTKLNVAYTEEMPTFYSIVLTNEQGIRSYIYILKIYEKMAVEKENVQTPGEERDTSLEYKGKFLYIPYALCLWSTIDNTEFFKGVMDEAYSVIACTGCSGCNCNDTVDTYRNLELLNMIFFLLDIVKPPSYVKMNVNFRFSTVEYITQSVFEIPCKEYNIKVLFDSLELSAIIKLWCSILAEKHIIILGNQHFLLFALCEALLNLIFPLKWLHTYIPVLPQDQLDFLESPPPYIMGVLSAYADLEQLKSSFPNHIICDVNTSVIYGNSFCTLPVNEDAKLRKKIQYARSPHLYHLEEIHPNSLGNIITLSNNCKNLSNKSLPSNTCLNIEDVGLYRSFAANIQYIFFRIFRNSLQGIKKYIFNDGTFDSHHFLEDLSDDSMKFFWERIIHTAAFEYFILNFQYEDESFTKIFQNICKCPEDKLELLTKGNNFFNFSMNLPTNLVSIFEQIDAVKIRDSSTSEEHLKDYHDMVSDYDKMVNAINKEKFKKTETEFRKTLISANSGRNALLSSFKNMKRSCKFSTGKKRLTNLSYDLVDENFREGLDFNRPLVHKRAPSNKDSLNLTNSVVSPSSPNINILPYVVQNNEKLKLYGEKGFLNFLRKLFEGVKETYEIGYHSEIMKALSLHTSHNIIRKGNDISNIEEENECEIFSSNSGEKNSNFLNTPPMNDIIEINKADCYQYYLLVAFYLDEYAALNDHALEMFKQAYLKDKKSFPKVRFSQFLRNLPNSELKHVIGQIDYDLYPGMYRIVYNKISIKETMKSYFKLANQKRDLRKKVYKNTEKEERLPSVSSFHSSSSEESQSRIKEKTENVEKNKEDMSITNSNLAFKRRSTVKMVTVQIPRKGSNSAIHQMTNTSEGNKSRKPSYVTDLFENKMDAQKIIDSMKLFDPNDKIVRVRLININLGNTFGSINNNSSLRDPMALAEDISVRLLNLILKNSLNKYKPEFITPQLFKSITCSTEFEEIKYLVYQLQHVNLKLLKTDNYKACFWLNIYNFLTIFTIFFKNEILTNYYEWYCFLKNSCFDIGGYEVSLYEIENFILKNNLVCLNNYGIIPSFFDNDERKGLILKTVPKYMVFGISLPTNSCPCLRIYFPQNLNELLKFNAIEYFQKNIKVDVENGTLCIPEYLNWIDNNFIDNIQNYAELLEDEFTDFVFHNAKELTKSVTKYLWLINLNNII